MKSQQNPLISYTDIQQRLDEYDARKGIRRKVTGDKDYIKEIKVALKKAKDESRRINSALSDLDKTDIIPRKIFEGEIDHEEQSTQQLQKKCRDWYLFMVFVEFKAQLDKHNKENRDRTGSTKALDDISYKIYKSFENNEILHICETIYSSEHQPSLQFRYNASASPDDLRRTQAMAYTLMRLHERRKEVREQMVGAIIEMWERYSSVFSKESLEHSVNLIAIYFKLLEEKKSVTTQEMDGFVNSIINLDAEIIQTRQRGESKIETNDKAVTPLHKRNLIQSTTALNHFLTIKHMHQFIPESHEPISDLQTLLSNDRLEFLASPIFRGAKFESLVTIISFIVRHLNKTPDIITTPGATEDDNERILGKIESITHIIDTLKEISIACKYHNPDIADNEILKLIFNTVDSMFECIRLTTENLIEPTHRSIFFKKRNINFITIFHDDYHYLYFANFSKFTSIDNERDIHQALQQSHLDGIFKYREAFDELRSREVRNYFSRIPPGIISPQTLTDIIQSLDQNPTYTVEEQRTLIREHIAEICRLFMPNPAPQQQQRVVARPPANTRLNPNQSTHTSSVEQSASESAKRLFDYFKKEGVTLHPRFTIDRFLTELLKLKNTFKNAEELNSQHPHLDTAITFLDNMLNTITRKRPDYRNEDSGVSTTELMTMAVLSLDEKALRTHVGDTGVETITERDDARNRLIEGLFDIRRGYNLDENFNDLGGDSNGICSVGTFNKIIQAMCGINNLVSLIFITKYLAIEKLKTTIREQASIYLRGLPQITTQDKENYARILNELKSEGTVEPISKDIRVDVLRIFKEDAGSLYNSEAEISDVIDTSINFAQLDDNFFTKLEKAEMPNSNPTMFGKKPDPSPNPNPLPNPPGYKQ